MSQVLQKLRDVDPADSDAVKEAITSFFQNLLKHTKDNCNVWLRVLEDLITRFPRYCSQHRPTIENYIGHFLESSNYYNVIVAAKCAHGLQQIRPSQDKTANPKNCWREQMSILCNAADALIEAIFSSTVNIYKNNNSVKKKGPELLANSPLTAALTNKILSVKKSDTEDKKIVLCNKLRNVFIFIQAMLVEIYPVAKPVQPQLVLEVIVQALSVSSSVNTDAKEAATVKTQALRTLDAMILCLGPNLIPFSGLVFRFVMQTLKWSSEHPGEESSKVRITAYNSLSKWLSTLHVHQLSTEGRGRSWEDELTSHIIHDITPVTKTVQLTMSNQYMKNLSKKAKRKLANQMLQQSNIATHAPGEKNKANVSEESSDEVANAALECTETFLTVSGIFLKPTTHKIFQERLVHECYNLHNYSDVRALHLVRALDAARKNTPSTVPAPTQYTLQLYSTLVNTRCDEIRKFCSQALLDIRLHLHCAPPSISFSLDAQPDTKADKSKKKEISKENREALESMIKERARPLSSDDEDTQEEAIGEPSQKRPRLDEEEEEEERISISSDSVTSVPEEDSEDEVKEIVEENTRNDADEVEVLPDPETEESSPKTSEDSAETIENIVSVEDSADTADSSTNNNRKRKSTEPEDKPSIYDAKTQIPVNAFTDTIDGPNSPGSMEIAYDASDTGNKVVRLEKQDEDNLPSTNETDDVPISCGQIVIVSQESESPKDDLKVEIEITTMDTKDTEIEQNEETKENDGEIAANDNNIEVKITSQEISIENMLADFVDEVNDEPSLVA